MKLILALCLLTLPLLGQEWPKEWGIKPDTNVLSDGRLIGWDSVEISNIDPEDNKKREVRKLALNNLLQYLSVNVKSEMTSKDRYVSAIGSLIKEIDGKTVVDIIDTKEQITTDFSDSGNMSSEFKDLSGLISDQITKIDNDGKKRLYYRYILDVPALRASLGNISENTAKEIASLLGQSNPKITEMKKLQSDIKESINQIKALSIILVSDEDKLIEERLRIAANALDALIFRFDGGGLSQEQSQLGSIINKVIAELGWQLVSRNAAYTIKVENFDTEDIAYKITPNIPGIMVRGDVILRVYGNDNKEFRILASAIGRGNTKNQAWRKFLEGLEKPLRTEFSKLIDN